MWDNSTITDAGLNLLAQWAEGTTLNISSAAGGTGTVQADALVNQVALVSRKQEASIVSIERKTNTITVKLQLTANTEEYLLQQIGIFAALDGGAEKLLAIFQDTNGVQIPAASSGQEFAYSFYAVLAIENSGTLTVQIDESAFISRSTLDEEMETKQDAITASGLLYRNSEGVIVAAVAGTDYVIPSALSTVALSGNYEDLSGTPTIPSKLSELTNDANYMTETSKGTAGGVASLDENGTIPVSQIPALSYVSASDKGSAGGVASLDSTGKVPASQLPEMDYIPNSEKAAAGGVATLADDGKVPASQLRGGFVISATAPTDTTLLWIDSSSVLRYYTGSTWAPVAPVWG